MPAPICAEITSVIPIATNSYPQVFCRSNFLIHQLIHRRILRNVFDPRTLESFTRKGNR